MMAVGILGNVANVFMMWGPLAAVRTVLNEKSTRSLPFMFTRASGFNSGLWTLYGVGVIQDTLMRAMLFILKSQDYKIYKI